MPLDFPASPTNGQIYDRYVYNSTTGTWNISPLSTLTISGSTLNINGANPSIATSQTTGTSNILTGFNGTINIGSSTSTVTIGNTIVFPNTAGTVALTSNIYTLSQTLRSVTGSTDIPTSTDIGKLITIDTTTGAVTVTINSSLGLSAGQKIDFAWIGAATSVTFAASSTTLNGTPGLKLRARYSAASLICLSSNTYLLVGDLSA